MKRRSNSWISIFLLLILSLSACTNKKVYDKYVHTPLAGWEKNDSLAFTIAPLKAAGEYNMALKMRTDNSFPFMSVVLIVEQTTFPNRHSVADTIKCHLTDDNGKALGEGINIYQHRFNISDRRYNEGDSIYITVRHDMKREILPGISEVGITLSRK